MKKVTNFSRMAMASMALAALGASAQGVFDIPFLAKKDLDRTAQATLMQKAPLNQDKAKGTFIFGSMFDDFNRYRNFSSFYSNQASLVTKIKRVAPESDDDLYVQLFGVMAGCYDGDGSYVAIRLKLYSLGITYLHDVVKVNPATGETTVLYSYTEKEQSTLPLPYDLAYNPADGKIYALAYDRQDDNNIPVTKLCTLDLKTGRLNDVCSLGHYYFAHAFDYDGNLYGVTWTYARQGSGDFEITGSRLDRFDDEFEIDKSQTLKVNEQAFRPQYQHTLEFDYTTGDLFWGATDIDANEQLVRINPDNGETTTYGRIGYNEIFLGMYIPFRTADARTAPAMVSNLAYTVDPEGANKTTLSWTNPTTQWNRKALNDLVEVNIYRDKYEGTPVGTVAAAGKVGENMSWTDETADRGVHKYYVVASSKKGEKGIMDSISCFVGRDLPGAPTDVRATTTDAKTVTVTWGAPNRGDSDGWFDKDVTYTVTRMPGNTVLVENTTDMTLRDTDIPEATLYSYHVVATNAEGPGEAGISNGVFAGQSIKLPYHTDLSDEVEANRFTTIDANGDGRTFAWDFNTNLFRNSIRFDQNDNANDDYLVSPPLAVKAGHSYRVTYVLSVGRYGVQNQEWYQSMNIVGGKGNTLAALTDKLAEFPEVEFPGSYGRNSISAEFSCDEDGEYFVAYHNNYSPNDGDLSWMYVEDVLIEEIFENDLRASDLETAAVLSSKTDNVFKVKVTNLGSKTQKDYTVKVAFLTVTGNKVDFAETSDVPELKHNESAVIELKGKPEVEVGDYSVVGYVVLLGDEFTDNDVTDEAAVSIDDKEALNVKILQDNDLGTSTNTPMQFYNPYSACQTVYSPDMLGIASEDGDDTLNIYRLAYDYTSDRDIKDVELKIYMGQSTTNAFPELNKTWIQNNQELVFDGKVDIVKGRGVLLIDLDEKFEFDPSMSLVVTVLKKSFAVAGEFPVHFDTFHNEIASPWYHSIRYNGGTEFDMENTDTFSDRSYVDHSAPVLYLAVPGAVPDGVDTPVVGLLGADVRYADGRIYFSGVDAKNVAVYTVDGKLVKDEAVAAGASSVALDVVAGVYLVRVTDAEGVVYSCKINASK